MKGTKPEDTNTKNNKFLMFDAKKIQKKENITKKC